jgi:hypothetical protein
MGVVNLYARRLTALVGVVLASIALSPVTSSALLLKSDEGSYELSSSTYTLGPYVWSHPSSRKTVSCSCRQGFHVRSTKDKMLGTWVPDLTRHATSGAVSIVGSFGNASEPRAAMKVELWNQTFTSQTASFSWWCDS